MIYVAGSYIYVFLKTTEFTATMHCLLQILYKQKKNLKVKHKCHTYTGKDTLEGLLHEIFGPVYWPVWMHLGLNKNRFQFLNFKGAPSI
jgi:hypothetical protein